MDPFVGEIKMVGFSFAPRGYAFCNANLMPIQQNAALFSLLGTTFGGNGTTNFQLPDYRGRVPLGMGNGPGLTPVVQGEKAGTESTSILSANMPIHNHSVAIPAGTPIGTSISPTNTSFLATTNDSAAGAVTTLYLTGTPDTTLLPFISGAAGGNVPVQIRNPYLGTNFIIALNGVFPSRN